MITRVAACGLLCLFSACSVTSHRSGPTPWNPDSPRGASTSATSTSQPQQYSPDVLFMKAHGEFMLAREPWRPEVQASILMMPDSEVKGEPGDFNLQHTRFDIERRIPLTHPDAFIDVGFQYGNREYEFSTGAVGAHDETLHRASMTVTYGQFLDADTLVELDFNPGVWSDFSDSTLHHEDWQFYGRGLATWRFDKDLFLMGGVEYSGLFRKFDVYPLLGVAWVIDPNWRLDMLLPRQIRLTFNESEHNSLFVSLDLDGGEYQVHGPTTAAGPARAWRTINVQEFEASVGGMHRFNANFSVLGRIGMTMGGDYRWLSNGPGDYDGQLEPQLFVDVGFGWTF